MQRSLTLKEREASLLSLGAMVNDFFTSYLSGIFWFVWAIDLCLVPSESINVGEKKLKIRAECFE